MKPGDGRATRHVIRNLSKELRVWHFAWQQFNLDSVEGFKEQASKWLRDKSELSARTIEYADWREVYETFQWEAKFISRDGNTTT